MSRGVGEVELLGELLPDLAAIPIAVLTQLGSLLFVAVLLAVVYWHSDRPGAIRLSAALLVATGVWMVLKDIVGAPRPHQPMLDPETLSPLLALVFEYAVVDSGYGFPSGHAVTATVTYVTLAGIVSSGTANQRYALAAVLVAVIGLSRIALGVHYLVDVLAGVAIGLAVVGGMRILTERTDGTGLDAAFGFGAGLALANLAIGEPGTGSQVFAGLALAAFAGWQLHELRLTIGSNPDFQG
ncbi:phosphatase PAP2 family protein [Natranaeroarchaeum aerophilus]|uniref:Phosphatase PAP2 family protein n=1 Tax=Natranaeroarchaeum aerophilus TaxID=2917711 RepID=A0AAE3FTH3_9EURY|nr:phosphatase PAP2 family protein [Natranaeroarchaeum aerophilus]MCL9814830.1 phosphatase PAP2 family protein [Natranaeroarchaeum aerophilus]